MPCSRFRPCQKLFYLKGKSDPTCPTEREKPTRSRALQKLELNRVSKKLIYVQILQLTQNKSIYCFKKHLFFSGNERLWGRQLLHSQLWARRTPWPVWPCVWRGTMPGPLAASFEKPCKEVTVEEFVTKVLYSEYHFRQHKFCLNNYIFSNQANTNSDWNVQFTFKYSNALLVAW